MENKPQRFIACFCNSELLLIPLSHASLQLFFAASLSVKFPSASLIDRSHSVLPSRHPPPAQTVTRVRCRAMEDTVD